MIPSYTSSSDSDPRREDSQQVIQKESRHMTKHLQVSPRTSCWQLPVVKDIWNQFIENHMVEGFVIPTCVIIRSLL